MYNVLTHNDFIFKTRVTSEVPQRLLVLFHYNENIKHTKKGRKREVNMIKVRCFYLAFLIMDVKLEYF